MKLYR